MSHPTLQDLMAPLLALEAEVRKKALMRAKYEGLEKASTYAEDSAKFGGDLQEYAMHRFAYYLCSVCGHAYYGGERACAEAADVHFDPSELVCGGCSPHAAEQDCPTHGTEFLEYKCRFCCTVAVFFCFGTTHFCDRCHGQPGRMTSMSKDALPKCPAGPLGALLPRAPAARCAAHSPRAAARAARVLQARNWRATARWRCATRPRERSLRWGVACAATLRASELVVWRACACVREHVCTLSACLSLCAACGVECVA